MWGGDRIYDIMCVVVVLCVPLPQPFCTLLFLMLVAIGGAANEKRRWMTEVVKFPARSDCG